MNLSHYKRPLRKLKISHKMVAEYIGHQRVTVTNWLNGLPLPANRCRHISKEIDRLIAKRKIRDDDPDKQLDIRIVINYTREAVEDSLQLEILQAKAFLVEGDKETEIDSSDVPRAIYKQMKEELELSFPKQEKR